MKAGILLVEDDHFFAKVLKRYLEKADYEVIYCENGERGWETFQQRPFDACLLDVLMPGKDGFELAREIRGKDDHVPLFFISSRFMEEDKLTGFRSGADGYLGKPFNFEELALRIKVFLKRARLQPSRRLLYNIGTLTFDYTELKIMHPESGSCVCLPPKEAELLKYLCENANKKIKRENILMHVWGVDDFFVGRSMDVYMTRLRKHFRVDPTVKLETMHGQGFRFSFDNKTRPSYTTAALHN